MGSRKEYEDDRWAGERRMRACERGKVNGVRGQVGGRYEYEDLWA